MLPSAALLPLCEGFTLHGDYTLNVYNSRTFAAFAALGLSAVTRTYPPRTTAPFGMERASSALSTTRCGRIPNRNSDPSDRQ